MNSFGRMKMRKKICKTGAAARVRHDGNGKLLHRQFPSFLIRLVGKSRLRRLPAEALMIPHHD